LKRLVAGALVALLLVACSSSGGGAKQPEDEFLDSVEAVCREASSLIRKLTPGEEDAPAELLDIVGDAADNLNDLKPPAALSDDYDEYTTKVDEQVAAMGGVVEAIEVDDSSARQLALDDVNARSTDADLIVNGLGAIRCRGMIPFNALVDDGSGTDITTVTTPVTDESIPESSTAPPTEVTEVTSTPNTPLSIDTLPITDPTTPPTDTVTPETILPTDLSVEAVAPEGFQWIPFTPPDASGLYSNTVIGDLVVSYSAGEFQSLTDASISATVYVVTLSTEFTPRYKTAFEFWEAVDEGTDVVTPGGHTVHQQINAFEGVDCAVYTGTTRAMSLCTYTGVDGLPLIEQFLAVNPL
jgi:hypothetical protein